MELTCQLLVHAKEITYLPAADADVACRNIHVRTNYLVQLAHERLTETHNLGIALAAWGKVRAALTATHRQCCQRILKSLLKA